MPHPAQRRIAAIQYQGQPGAVNDNLERLLPLIEQAVRDGAEMVALPEFFPSPLPFLPQVHDSVLPPENPVRTWMLDLVRRHGITLGGSMLVVDGGRVVNRYHLVGPQGDVHLHDKDLPTMWENAFYGPGLGDDGVLQTGQGTIGAAVCWELIRAGTARRLRERVDLVMTGTHWWTVPENWGPASAALAGLGRHNRQLSEQAPAVLARLVGAPVVQASHCGVFETDLMLMPGLRATLPYRTRFVGATQIVDAEGRVLAWRGTDDGPGVVAATVTLGRRRPLELVPERFWLPRLPFMIRAYWHQQNACARRYYRQEGLERGLDSARRWTQEGSGLG